MDTPLGYFAALYALGSLDPDKAIAAVDRLTDEGVWDAAFTDVLFAHGREAHDVLPAFVRALDDLEAPIPSRRDAVRYLVDYHVNRMVLPGVDPLDELVALIHEVSFQPEFMEGTREFLGDAFGAEHLVGIYWSYDDWRGNPELLTPAGSTPAETRADFESRVREEAARLRTSR